MPAHRAAAVAHWKKEWPGISESHRQLAVDLTVACLESFPGSCIGARMKQYTKIDPPPGRARMSLVAAIQPMADFVQIHFLLSPELAERMIADGTVVRMRKDETHGDGIWVRMSFPVDRVAVARGLLQQSASFQFGG